MTFYITRKGYLVNRITIVQVNVIHYEIHNKYINLLTWETLQGKE